MDNLVQTPIFNDMADEFPFVTLILIYGDEPEDYDFSDIYEKYDILDKMA